MLKLDRWIVIPRWDGADGFQHYSNRDPVWIKNYTRLLHSDEYMGLTLHQRGVLHGLWITYAASGRQIRDSTATVSRQLGHRVSRATLDALNHAGFIEYSASKPLAACYPREEKEKEPPISPKPQPVENRREDPLWVNPAVTCQDCGEKLGHGHLEDCPRMPQLTAVPDVA